MKVFQPVHPWQAHLLVSMFISLEPPSFLQSLLSVPSVPAPSSRTISQLAFEQRAGFTKDVLRCGRHLLSLSPTSWNSTLWAAPGVNAIAMCGFVLRKPNNYFCNKEILVTLILTFKSSKESKSLWNGSRYLMGGEEVKIASIVSFQ